MKPVTIVFIHGYTATSEADWYPAIRPLLDKKRIKYIIPNLPGGDRPHSKEWLETLHREISKIKTPIVLIGHSLGTRTALLYLEKYRPKNVVLVLLIAAFSNDVDNGQRNDGETYPDFFEHQIDIPSVKKLAKKFIVLHSEDDSSIAYQQGKEIASELGAKLLTVTGRDHFSEPQNAQLIYETLLHNLPT